MRTWQWLSYVLVRRLKGDSWERSLSATCWGAGFALWFFWVSFWWKESRRCVSLPIPQRMHSLSKKGCCNSVSGWDLEADGFWLKLISDGGSIRVRQGLESQFCQSPSVWLWTSDLTFLGFSFLLCKMTMIILISLPLSICENQINQHGALPGTWQAALPFLIVLLIISFSTSPLSFLVCLHPWPLSPFFLI